MPMKWVVRGAHVESGKRARVTVSAADEATAIARGAQLGLAAETITCEPERAIACEPEGEPASRPRTRARAVATPEHPPESRPLRGRTILLAFLAVDVIALLGWGAHAWLGRADAAEARNASSSRGAVQASGVLDGQGVGASERESLDAAVTEAATESDAVRQDVLDAIDVIVHLKADFRSQKKIDRYTNEMNAALRVIGKHEDDFVVDLLVDACTAKPTPENASALVGAIGRRRTPAALRALESLAVRKDLEWSASSNLGDWLKTQPDIDVALALGRLQASTRNTVSVQARYAIEQAVSNNFENLEALEALHVEFIDELATQERAGWKRAFPDLALAEMPPAERLPAVRARWDAAERQRLDREERTGWSTDMAQSAIARVRGNTGTGADDISGILSVLEASHKLQEFCTGDLEQDVMAKLLPLLRSLGTPEGARRSALDRIQAVKTPASIHALAELARDPGPARVDEEDGWGTYPIFAVEAATCLCTTIVEDVSVEAAREVLSLRQTGGVSPEVLNKISSFLTADIAGRRDKLEAMSEMPFAEISGPALEEIARLRAMDVDMPLTDIGFLDDWRMNKVRDLESHVDSCRTALASKGDWTSKQTAGRLEAAEVALDRARKLTPVDIGVDMISDFVGFARKCGQADAAGRMLSSAADQAKDLPTLAWTEERSHLRTDRFGNLQEVSDGSVDREVDLSLASPVLSLLAAGQQTDALVAARNASSLQDDIKHLSPATLREVLGAYESQVAGKQPATK